MPPPNDYYYTRTLSSLSTVSTHTHHDPQPGSLGAGKLNSATVLGPVAAFARPARLRVTVATGIILVPSRDYHY
jgi:hypothetical protein